MTRDERLLQELSEIREQERNRMKQQAEAKLHADEQELARIRAEEQELLRRLEYERQMQERAEAETGYEKAQERPAADQIRQSQVQTRTAQGQQRPAQGQQRTAQGQQRPQQSIKRPVQGSAPGNTGQGQSYNLRGGNNYSDTMYDNGTVYEYETPRRRRDASGYEDEEGYEEEAPKKRRTNGNGGNRGGGSGKKKKKHFGLRLIRNILIIAAILSVLFVLAVNSVVSRFDHIETEVSKRDTAMKGKVTNILLIGQDAREGEGGQRSDSIILMTINRDADKVILTSFMRDLYVQIPDYGGNRINAAFAFGGVDLLDRTIEENFGITIDGNMIVDLEGFLEAFTAMGSLDIELSQEEADYMNEHPDLGESVNSEDATASEEWNWNLTAGMNTLNSHQLLAYSRMRHLGNSDWDRTARQRKVIMAAINKIKHGHFIKGIGMARNIAPHISTDISSSGMRRTMLGFLFNNHMENYQMPPEGTYSNEYIDDMAVLLPDMDMNREYLQKYMAGEGETLTEEEITEDDYNESYGEEY